MAQTSRFAKADAVEHAILNSDGLTSLETRKAITEYGASLDESFLDGIPDDVRPYLKKVVQYAHRVTDKDMQDLHNAGYTEEYVFEITIAATLGTAMVRLNKAFEVLEEVDEN